MKKIANPLNPGDVIQTHPQRGFWGCAVVLTARDGTDQSHAASHIGISTFIATRRYSWRSVDPQQLRIVESLPSVRVAPGEFLQSRDPRTCIGIYSVRTLAGIKVIGRIDSHLVYDKPLTFDVGDGTKGAFPLCGPIKERFGYEAVVAWRKVHDKERFEKGTVASRERFERNEQQRLSEQRATRHAKGT